MNASGNLTSNTPMARPDGEDHDYVGEAIPEGWRWVFIVVGLGVVVFGVFGNLAIIATVVRSSNMRGPHFFFIANLALADLLITGYLVPFVVMSLLIGRYPVFNSNHCSFNGFLMVFIFVASLHTLLAISINRYLCVCHNRLFERIFHRKTLSSLVGCCLTWLTAFLCTLPCLTGSGRFLFDRKGHYCGYDRTYRFSYTLFLLIASIGAPVVLVFLCNFAIWRFVRRASHRIHTATSGMDIAVANGNNSRGDVVAGGGEVVDDMGDDSKATTSTNVRDEGEFTRKRNAPLVTPDELALIKTVFTVFMCFAALMSPYMITALMDSENKWPAALHIACAYSSFTNCCLNCVLYGVMAPRFRKSFYLLFINIVSFGRPRAGRRPDITRT